VREPIREKSKMVVRNQTLAAALVGTALTAVVAAIACAHPETGFKSVFGTGSITVMGLMTVVETRNMMKQNEAVRLASDVANIGGPDYYERLKRCPDGQKQKEIVTDCVASSQQELSSMKEDLDGKKLWSLVGLLGLAGLVVQSQSEVSSLAQNLSLTGTTLGMVSVLNLVGYFLIQPLVNRQKKKSDDVLEKLSATDVSGTDVADTQNHLGQ